MAYVTNIGERIDTGWTPLSQGIWSLRDDNDYEVGSSRDCTGLSSKTSIGLR